MATFTGTSGADVANAGGGILTGFTGGTLSNLQDSVGDLFEGNQGSDTVIAGSGNDTINGELGGDFLNGGDGDDSISGGDNADTLIGGAGKDFLDGGDGADLIRYDLATDVANDETINGGNGIDTLQVGFGQSFASPTFFAFNASTFVISSVQVLDFEQTDGTVNVGLKVSDMGPSAITELNGSAGTDIVSFSNITGPLNLETLVLTNWTAGRDYVSISGTSASDSIIGSPGDDRINGNNGQDTVRGGEGNDRFSFVAQTSGVVVPLNSIADGGGGTDMLAIVGSFLNTSSITFAGQLSLLSVENLLVQPSGFLITATFDERQIGQGAIQTVDGTNGPVAIVVRSTFAPTIDISGVTFINWSASSTVTLLGAATADTLTGSTQAELLSGAAGNDVLFGGSGNDTVDGGENDDNLYGGAGADSLVGGTGFDIVRYDDAWGVQVDILFSNALGSFAAGDTFSGIEGVSGSNTDDGVWGTDENNTIFTWLGNDYIDGRGGVDVLLGGANNDTLVGGAGADYLAGEAGADVFRYLELTDSLATAQDYLPDFSSAQSDKIDVSAFAGTATFNSGFGTGTSVYAFSQGGGAWTMVQFYQGSTLHLQIVVNVGSMTVGDFIL